MSGTFTLLFCISPQRCDEREHWVCGSNGKSYRNHCELHREACLTQTKIHADHRGHCQGKYRMQRWMDGWMDWWVKQNIFVDRIIRKLNLNALQITGTSIDCIWDVFKDEAINLLPVSRVWTCSYPYLQRNPQREMWAPVSLLNLSEYEIINHFFAEFTVISCIVLHCYNTI